MAKATMRDILMQLKITNALLAATVVRTRPKWAQEAIDDVSKKLKGELDGEKEGGTKDAVRMVD